MVRKSTLRLEVNVGVYLGEEIVDCRFVGLRIEAADVEARARLHLRRFRLLLELVAVVCSIRTKTPLLGSN